MQHHSIPATINAIISSGHPMATLSNIYTFLWCLWKARNDSVFARKIHQQQQIFAAAKAIIRGAQLEERQTINACLETDLQGQENAPGRSQEAPACSTVIAPIPPRVDRQHWIFAASVMILDPSNIADRKSVV